MAAGFVVVAEVVEDNDHQHQDEVAGRHQVEGGSPDILGPGLNE